MRRKTRADREIGRRWRFIAAVAAVSCLALSMPGTAAESLPGSAVISDGVMAGTKPLHNLSRDDLRRYRAAFDAQERGDFAEADRQIASLDDLMLVGHLLRERFLDTARYGARQRELAEWLAAYDDLPGYEDIEAMAAAGTPSGAGDGFAASRAAATAVGLSMMDSPLDMMPLEPRGRDDA
ncbi:MAG: hypothetical protein WAZ62_14710, partial [Zavarzinia sp.]